MNRLLSSLIVMVVLVLFAIPSAYSAPLSCQSLLDAAPPGVKITNATRMLAEPVNVPFCLVSGVMATRQGLDGKAYAIHFELRLPDAWQGRFAYQFNDGSDGYVKPALGAIAGLDSTEYAINQGFAVLSSDGGHDGSANLSDGVVGSSLFGHDPQARFDYAYGAVAKLNPIARRIIEHYYQAKIQYSYALGAGNGGRVAMVVAARFPQMFDGLLVFAPGLNQPKAALQAPWDAQILQGLQDDSGMILRPRDLALFAQQLLAQCDGLDGLRDNLIFAIETCQEVFQPTQSMCHGPFDRDCLDKEKVAALINMHRGPHNSKNIALYTDWVFDTGIRSQNWRHWKLQSNVAVWDYQAFHRVLTAAALANVYMTPPFDVAGTVYSLETFLLNFDFDQDTPRLQRTQAPFTVSAMTQMTPPNVARPRLDKFKQSGGKMILYHGNSDPVFSVQDSVRWYNFLDFYHEGKAAEFVQFYRIPGMPHGQGGASVDKVNMLQPLVSWVEQQQAAQQVIAYTRRTNPEITPSMIGLSRPLCPYPSYAHYQQGDLRSAASFICR